MSRFIIPLKETYKDLEREIGTYAAGLGELQQAGFPFVDSFSVTVFAYFNFLHENNLIPKINSFLSHVNFDHPESVMQTSANIKKMIVNSALSKDLSSEIHSAYRKLSGALKDTHVSISLGDTGGVMFRQVQGETNLIQKIKESWAECFSPDQIAMYHGRSIDQFKKGHSLIVQQNLDPDESGILLTENPMGSDSSKIIIEVKGVHEHYEIQKEKVLISDQIISTKNPHLSYDQVIALATLGKKLEKHLYFPQEIHWVIIKNSVYILRYKKMPSHAVVHNAAHVSLPSRKLLAKGTGISAGIAHGTVKIVKKSFDFNKILSGDVLVTNDIPQNYLQSIKHASAVVLEKGGKATPAAYTLRSFGIPSVALEKATDIFKNNQSVVVNGSKGEIYLNSDHPASKKTIVDIFVNLTSGFQDNKMSADGALIEGQSALSSNELEKKILKTAKLFSPHKVIYKLSDFEEDQVSKFGMRGTHRLIHKHGDFTNELDLIRKLRDEKDLKNIWLLLPFVRNGREFNLAKEIIKDARLHRGKDFKLWITIATPAGVININELINIGVDGLLIDIDELTALFTGVDEKLNDVASIFDPLDSSVLQAVETVVKTANKHGIVTAIAGKSLSDHPSLIDKVIEYGIKSIFVNPEDIDQIRQNIISTERKLAG